MTGQAGRHVIWQPLYLKYYTTGILVGEQSLSIRFEICASDKNALSVGARAALEPGALAPMDMKETLPGMLSVTVAAVSLAIVPA